MRKFIFMNTGLPTNLNVSVSLYLYIAKLLQGWRKIVRKLLVFFGVLVMLLVIGQLVEAQGLTYEGSTTIGETIMPEAAKVFEAKTKIKFDYIGGLGSGNGFKAVMEGKCYVAGVSRALKPNEKKQKPYYQIIGYDAIAVFVNKRNPVKDLSKEQVKGIFTGKIKNWKEVGGKDAEIVVVTERKTGGTITAFKELALDDAEFGPTKEIDTQNECVKYVAKDENSITHASIAFKEPGIKYVIVDNVEPNVQNIRSGSYPFSRPLILVAKKLPKGNLKKFFDFILSPEGQEIVKKNFVSVK